MDRISKGIKEDARELKFNLRTGDPDTYLLGAVALMSVVALVGWITGWL